MSSKEIMRMLENGFVQFGKRTIRMQYHDNV